MADDDDTTTETKKASSKKEAEETAAVDEQAVQDVVSEVVNAAAAATSTSPAAKKKRLCRYPGCTKVIKSQGHCQRHGARAKRCKVEGCEKQAQGTHEGMCKRHWKAVHFPAPPSKPEKVPPPPEGESVYDTILPASVSYRPNNNAVLLKTKPKGEEEKQEGEEESKAVEVVPLAGTDTLMPLVAFLKNGSSKKAGWHREAERRARGTFPVTALSSQLEPWERQLALLEIFLLSGGTPHANMQDLAHAWGREKGFHQLLTQNICERRGEVERKKRSDAGKTMTPEERQAFREKLKKARLSSGKDNKEEEEEGKEGDDMDTTPAEDLKPASVEEMVETADDGSKAVSV